MAAVRFRPGAHENRPDFVGVQHRQCVEAGPEGIGCHRRGGRVVALGCGASSTWAPTTASSTLSPSWVTRRAVRGHRRPARRCGRRQRATALPRRLPSRAASCTWGRTTASCTRSTRPVVRRPARAPRSSAHRCGRSRPPTRSRRRLRRRRCGVCGLERRQRLRGGRGGRRCQLHGDPEGVHAVVGPERPALPAGEIGADCRSSRVSPHPSVATERRRATAEAVAHDDAQYVEILQIGWKAVCRYEPPVLAQRP
jgi:hypothetical protein